MVIVCGRILFNLSIWFDSQSLSQVRIKVEPDSIRKWYNFGKLENYQPAGWGSILRKLQLKFLESIFEIRAKSSFLLGGVNQPNKRATLSFFLPSSNVLFTDERLLRSLLLFKLRKYQKYFKIILIILVRVGLYFISYM